MITRYGRHDLAFQQAIGYSCVLFAWIVVVSIKMEKFCPIIFVPDMCFSNIWIPLDVLSFGLLKPLPINFGPIILLFVTKLIIPRSSFIGHLSGIIIGYPLAWNALNWLTPPVLLSIGSLLLIYTYSILPSSSSDDGFVPSRRYHYMRIAACILVFCNIIYVVTINSTQFLLYVVSSYLAVSTMITLKEGLHRHHNNNDTITLNADIIEKLISISVSEMQSLVHHSSFKVTTIIIINIIITIIITVIVIITIIVIIITIIITPTPIIIITIINIRHYM